MDIYLPDLNYLDGASAARYSLAPDYPQIAIKAIEEMYRQVGDCQMNQKGMLQKGVLVRHLVLPGNLENSRAAVSYTHLHAGFGRMGHPPLCSREQCRHVHLAGDGSGAVGCFGRSNGGRCAD